MNLRPPDTAPTRQIFQAVLPRGRHSNKLASGWQKPSKRICKPCATMAIRFPRRRTLRICWKLPDRGRLFPRIAHLSAQPAQHLTGDHNAAAEKRCYLGTVRKFVFQKKRTGNVYEKCVAIGTQVLGKRRNRLAKKQKNTERTQQVVENAKTGRTDRIASEAPDAHPCGGKCGTVLWKSPGKRRENRVCASRTGTVDVGFIWTGGRAANGNRL